MLEDELNSKKIAKDKKKANFVVKLQLLTAIKNGLSLSSS